jgi:hypothetical protein
MTTMSDLDPSNASLTLILGALSLVACGSPGPASVEADAAHLFILSGQSNMDGLDPDESFTPMVEAEFGAERVIVVKDAHDGQPIRRWCGGR